MIASALHATGLRTGLYLPRIWSTRASAFRSMANGSPRRTGASLSTRFTPSVESLLAEGRIDTHPSFFETLTAMAFVAFARLGVEVGVLETGLGGRLDATNVVDPEITVITPIDFDHEAFLGSSIESIAAEKAGIVKAGRPVVLSTQRPAAFGILERRALEVQAPVTFSRNGASKICNLKNSPAGSH